jgi:hypothetical protein
MTPLNWTFLNVVVVVTDTTTSKKFIKNTMKIVRLICINLFIYAFKNQLRLHYLQKLKINLGN